jgi:hypothetical protein
MERFKCFVPEISTGSENILRQTLVKIIGVLIVNQRGQFSKENGNLNVVTSRINVLLLVSKCLRYVTR